MQSHQPQITIAAEVVRRPGGDLMIGNHFPRRVSQQSLDDGRCQTETDVKDTERAAQAVEPIRRGNAGTWAKKIGSCVTRWTPKGNPGSPTVPHGKRP